MIGGTIIVTLSIDSEIIFEAHGKLIGYKGIMESLMPGSKIHASVVDIWVAIQNDLEKRRSTSARSRVFVHSDIMVAILIHCVNEIF